MPPWRVPVQRLASGLAGALALRGRAAAQTPPDQPGDLLARQADRIQELERLAAGPAPLAVGLFVLLVALVAFGLGRYAWQLRRDYVGLVAAGAGPAGVPADRLGLFRDSPAGLPDGSIRGVLAVAIVLVALPALVLSRSLGLAGTGELGTILGGVLGFYFGTRSGGGEAEAARRQAGQSLAEAAAARAAQDQAEAAAAAARREAEAAAAAAQARAGEAATRLGELGSRAAEAIATARAVAGLLPAGPGAVLAGAAQATEAIGAALRDPTEASVTRAVDAAALLLREAGEGTELAGTLGGALAVARDAAGAIGAVRSALADPSPARIADALGEAARVVAGRGDGGLGAALAPALAVLGPAMRLPGLAGALGVATPVGVAGAVLLGAWQAAQAGRQHYLRWMARVLDRPVTRELFPAGEWDGEAARALIGAEPAIAAALAGALGPEAPQEAAAAALARLLEPGAAAWLHGAHPAAFASPAEAEAAVARLRRRLLDAELDRVEPAPVAGLGLPAAQLRADLDRLREAGAGGAIDRLALLAEGLVAAQPEGGAPGLPDLLRRALSEAERAQRLETLR